MLVIVAHADRIDLVRAELEKLIPTTRAEAGCVQYDLHQDNDDPQRFLFFEAWEVGSRSGGDDTGPA